MSYHFDGVAGLIEFFEQEAAKFRKGQEQAESKTTEKILANQAVNAEYYAAMLKNSNLATGRVVYANYDIDDVIYIVNNLVAQIDVVMATLAGMKARLSDSHTILEEMKEK